MLTVTFWILLVLGITLGNSLTLTILISVRHFRTPRGYQKTSLATV